MPWAAYLEVARTGYEMAVSGEDGQMTRWWLRVRAGWK